MQLRSFTTSYDLSRPATILYEQHDSLRTATTLYEQLWSFTNTELRPFTNSCDPLRTATTLHEQLQLFTNSCCDPSRTATTLYEQLWSFTNSYNSLRTAVILYEQLQLFTNSCDPLRTAPTVTRHCNQLQIPKYRKSICQQSFLYRATKIWNSLSGEHREIKSLKVFKNSVKRMLLDNWLKV